ncbi:MAG: histidine--tRNA ligase [Bacteroidota bacterium]
MEKPGLPSGTRDFGPETMIQRKYILSIMQQVFESHGFGALETPALENLKTLQGKYGEEGDQLLFKVLNSGDFLSKADNQWLAEKNSKALAPSISDRGLRYDLTVPMARFVVMNRDKISFPFKRYQMQPVWRADRPQKGRYREFWQCDIDVVGANSIVSEAELIEMYQEVFAQLKLGVVIRINHRGILDAFVPMAGSLEAWQQFMIVIDKADKIGSDGVVKELNERGLCNTVAAWEFLEKTQELPTNEDKLAALRSFADGLNNQEFKERLVRGVFDISKILTLVESNQNVHLDVSLARGLSYYTGTVMEVVVDDGKVPADFKIGSIGGGGRYDNLTGMFGLKDVSGVGVSFGLDRIYDVLQAAALLPSAGTEKHESCLVCAMDEACLDYAYDLCNRLRKQGEKIELYPGTPKLKKQLEYANQRNFGSAIIIGDSEMEQKTYVMKNLVTGAQETRKFPQ